MGEGGSIPFMNMLGGRFPGAQFLITGVLVDPGDIVVTSWPSYFVYTGTLQAAGARVRCVDMDDDGMIPEALERTLADIEAFADTGAADYLQIKMPDLGSLTNSVEAVLRCRRAGVGAYLGGSCNETDVSARLTVHVGLATGADYMLAKPGFGIDEALMVMRNEMLRTLALLGDED